MQQELMKAALCNGYGGPEKIEVKYISKPKPKANELLVKVMASTINSGDVRVRGLKVEGLMRWVMRIVLGFSKPKKSVLGVTFSGIIEAMGDDVSYFKVGDKIFGLTGFRFGTHAEYLVVSKNATLMHMPINAGFEEAAALPFGVHTALYFLQQNGIERRAGLDVLIYGSSGAVGAAAVQVAQNYKANVFAVCSSKSKALMEHLQVSNICFYDQENFNKLHQKFDIIFDAVGKISKKDCAHLLKPEGKFATVGGWNVAKEMTTQLAWVKEKFESNEYKAIIDKTYSLDKIAQAHAYVDTERKQGNVVVRIGI